MNDLSKLALAGLLGGGLVLTHASCSGGDESATESGGAADEASAGIVDGPHACAGMNACKGLGGCEVSQAKLEELAAAMDKPIEEAGSPHACAGQNACKGLGGCAVTAEKLAELKAARKD